VSTTTRHYLPSTASGANTPPAAPPIGAMWTATGSPSRSLLRDTASGSGYASRTVTESTPGSAYTTPYQFVGPELAGGLVPAAARLVMKCSTAGSSYQTQLAFRLAVVSSDGATVRAELFSGHGGTANTSAFLSTARAVATGELPYYSTVAGDRLVLETGLWVIDTNTTTSGRGGNIGVGDPLAGADLLDGQTTDGRAWLEVDWIEPPHVVSALTLAPGADTIAATWAPPVTGPAPAGYLVSLDGAPAVDVGNVLGYTFENLDPGTSYTVSVFAYVDGFTGPAAHETTTTLALPFGYYRATLELAGHTWTATRGDTPALGVALPLSFGWAMAEDGAGYPAQLEVGTAPLLLVVEDGTDLDGVDVGSAMRVRVWFNPDPDAEPYATFTGVVGDLEVSPHPRGVAARLLGVDWTTELAGRTVGSTEWPQESGDARAARIMAENGDEPWTSETIGNTFEPRTGQAVSAYDALRETLTAAARYSSDDWSAPGRVLLTVDTTDAGTLDTFRGRFAAAESTAIDKLPTAVWRATSWMRNRVTDGRWVHIDHPGGPSTYGDVRGAARPRLAVPVYDVDALAQLALGTVPGFSWVSAAPLRLDLSHPDAVPPPGWFSGPLPGIGRVVVVDVEAMPGVFTRYAGMLAAATLTLEPGGRVYIDFRLRPDVPAHSSVTPRWEDEPIDQTWLDEPPDATWHELRTIHREDYLS
jgi:hypothetical protein